MTSLARLGKLGLSQFYKSYIKLETRVSPKAFKYYSTNTGSEKKEEIKNDNSNENEEIVLSENEKKLIEENNKLLEKVKVIDDNFKRALADSENFRVRKNKEIEETKKFAVQSFSKDLLEVADILSMAIDSVPKESIEENKPFKALFEGVKMTEKQLQTIFRRHGIVQINPLNEKFNPNEHEALCYVEDKTKIGDTVFVVNKIGYKLKDRVIRAASVGVVKN